MFKKVKNSNQATSISPLKQSTTYQKAKCILLIKSYFFPTGKSGKILFVLFVFHVYVWACNLKFIEACNKLWAMVFPSKHKFYSSAVLFLMKNGISLSSPINVIKDHINRGPNNYGLFVVLPKTYNYNHTMENSPLPIFS